MQRENWENNLNLIHQDFMGQTVSRSLLYPFGE